MSLLKKETKKRTCRNNVFYLSTPENQRLEDSFPLDKKPIFQLPTPNNKNAATHSLPEKTQFPKQLPQTTTQTTTTPTIPLESSHLKVGTDLACKGCKACLLLNVASMAGAKNSRFCGGLGNDGPMAGRLFG